MKVAIEKYRLIIETSALVIGASWAGWFFYYSEYIKPLQRPKTIILKTHTQSAGHKGNAQAIKVDIEIENIGDRSLNVSEIRYNLMGYKLFSTEDTPYKKKDTTYDLIEEKNVLNGDFVLQGHKEGNDNIISEGQLGSDVFYLYPKEKMQLSYIFYTKIGAYDAVRIQVTLLSYDRSTSESLGIRIKNGRPQKYNSDENKYTEITNDKTETKALRKKLEVESTSTTEFYSLFDETTERNKHAFGKCIPPIIIGRVRSTADIEVFDNKQDRINRDKKAESFKRKHQDQISKIARDPTKYPDLIDLIAATESMDDKERVYWLDIIPSMTDTHIERLYKILNTERIKLNELESKYQKEIHAIQNKTLTYSDASLCKW